MMCLSQEGSKKSIMLKEKRFICVLWTYRKLLTEHREKHWNGQ